MTNILFAIFWCLEKILCPCKLTLGYLFKTFGCSMGVWNIFPQNLSPQHRTSYEVAHRVKHGKLSKHSSRTQLILLWSGPPLGSAPVPASVRVTHGSVFQPSLEHHLSSVCIKSWCQMSYSGNSMPSEFIEDVAFLYKITPCVFLYVSQGIWKEVS